MTMPSGDDPEGYSLDGFDGPIVSGGVDDLHNRTEANVRSQKQAGIEGNSIFNTILDMMFEGLERIPGIGWLASILKKLLKTLFGFVGDLPDLVSTLFNMIERIPGVSELIDIIHQLTGINLHTIWQDFGDFIGIDFSSPIAFITTVVEALLNFPEFILRLVNKLFNRAYTTVSQATNWLLNFAEKAFGWVSGFFNALTGQSRGVEDVDVEEAAAQAAALMEAAIAAATNNELGAGVYGGDDFNRVVDNLSEFWNESYQNSKSANGFYRLDGAEAVWVERAGAQFCLFRRTFEDDAVTPTDQQAVSAVIGKYRGEGNVFADQSGKIYLWLRLNEAESQGVCCEITSNNSGRIRIGYRNGGSTIFPGGSATVNAGAVQGGATYKLRSHVDGEPRKFGVYKNGVLVCSWFDESNVTAMGSDNRGWGWGARAEVVFFNQSKPGNLAVITISED
jgi:hypothetical protein